MLALLGLCGTLLLAAQDDEPATHFVSASVNINVRSQPDHTSTIIATLAPGSQVRVIETVEGTEVSGNTTWYQVSLSEELAYVHSSLLQPLPFVAPTPPPNRDPREPANPNALPAARNILAFLYSLPERSESRVISGQFGAYGTGTGRHTAENQLRRIYDQSGYWPAMTGMDYARWDLLRENDYTEPNEFLIEQWELGSLVNISWHAPNPWTGGPSNDWQNPETANPYDTRDVMALITPGSRVHTQWMRMLDDVASGLQQLQDAGVIVIWRPLHEMNMGWAWWHRQPQESFIALWRHMFNYFTYEKELNNLLWAYTPGMNGSEWDVSTIHYYPGRDYVDIVGLDKYMGVREERLQLNRWNEYNDLLTLGQPIGLFEFGPLPATGQGWNEIRYDYSNLIRDIRELYPEIIAFQAWEYVWQIGNHYNAIGLFSDPWVISRGELPDWNSPDFTP